MKKILFFLLSIFLIYLFFIAFFHINVLNDSTFSRKGKWTYKNVSKKTDYIRFENNSYIIQKFDYPSIPDTKYRIKFFARKQYSDVNDPLLVLYIDGICYSVFRINSYEWKEYVSTFKLVSYSFSHSFMIKMVSGSSCDLMKIFMNPTFSFKDKSNNTQIFDNLLVNGDFINSTNGWHIFVNDFFITNLFGITALAFNCNNFTNEFLFSSDEYELDGGKEYLISGFFMSNNNKLSPTILFENKLNHTYNNGPDFWTYNELYLSPISNIYSNFKVKTSSTNMIFFTGFRIIDISIPKNSENNNINLLHNSTFTNNFSNWDGSLRRFSIVSNSYHKFLEVNNTVNDVYSISQDFNVISGAFYSFYCNFKYFPVATNGNVTFTIAYLDDKGEKIYREFFPLKYSRYDINKWYPFKFSFCPKVTSRAKFSITTRNVYNLFLDDISLKLLNKR